MPDDDERMDFGAVEEPMSQSEVKLAKTAGEFLFNQFCKIGN
jgi:hypothetical protein